jgi:hypothetical protein
MYIRSRYPYDAAMSRFETALRPVWLATAIFLTIPATGWAQSGNVEALLRGCADIAEDNRRLACYDQVLIPAKAAELPTAATRAATVTVPEEEAVGTGAKPEVQEQQVEKVAAESAIPAAEDDFGLPQEQSRETVRRAVTVQSVRKNLEGRYLYTTDSGQVWLQIDTRKVRYGEVPFAAEIRSGSLGSCLLKPVSDGVSVKVRRER